MKKIRKIISSLLVATVLLGGEAFASNTDNYEVHAACNHYITSSVHEYYWYTTYCLKCCRFEDVYLTYRYCVRCGQDLSYAGVKVKTM